MHAALIDSVRSRAGERCEYCLMPQAFHVLTFPIDHIIARQHDGANAFGNLALSCTRCNSYKGPNIAGLDPATGELTRLFHPRNDDWREHFCFVGAMVEGLTDVGRTTLKVLQLNHPDSIALRESLIAEGVLGHDL